jgi:hypothetical protein
MWFSAERSAYSAMPSFLNKSEISRIAATDGLVVVQPSFGLGPQRLYPEISRIARYRFGQAVVLGAEFERDDARYGAGLVQPYSL